VVCACQPRRCEESPEEVKVRLFLALMVAVFALGSAAGFGAASLVTPRSHPAPVGVIRYMEALRRHDGKQVWASYSRAFQEQHIRDGGSEADTIAFFEEQRQKGARIDEEAYVGGYQAPESGYYLFVTRHFRPNQATIEVVWIVQTDDAGLIDRIVI
jgi:hypothetical protein